MGSHSEATELQPSSITLTPLGLRTQRQWRSISEESQCSLASLYTSPGFNLPEQLVAGLRNLTPSIPSITGSHQVSSTWPASILTPGLPSPHLTIDQANSMYKLAAECQALGIKLAKKFQVLSSLEAIHHNSIQGTMHDMLTMGAHLRRPHTLPLHGTESLMMNVRPPPAIFAQRLMWLGKRCLK